MRKGFLAALIIASAANSICGAPNRMKDIGIVLASPDGQNLCLAAYSTRIKRGDTVLVVYNGRKEQSVQKVIITERLKGNCSSNLSTDTGYSFFRIEAIKKSMDDLYYSLAILDSRSKYRNVHGKILCDIDNDGVEEEFKTCAGTEGLHLSIGR